MLKAPRNRTITLSEQEKEAYRRKLSKVSSAASLEHIRNRVVNEDLFCIIDWLPPNFVDLLFIDPPYNLTKRFNTHAFKQMPVEHYTAWLESWLPKMLRLLKPTASVYICGDWRSSSAIHQVCDKYLMVRNRITFEREKGRGAKTNWKNNCEDIWFCTMSRDYYFDAQAVKLKRQVIAPYRENGQPKDWAEEQDGKYRLTYPSNIWTDISIPFWSMPENTPHPTQKPEKLLAKIILASSREGDLVLDPFAGVGTTGVVAKKLKRNFVMVEIDEEYCLYALKRLQMAEENRKIQGYVNGVFWERNTQVRDSGCKLTQGDKNREIRKSKGKEFGKLISE
ncbi:site-specific DNA-methyltransferase [Candidatus Poribacteria bacterium]|nr:site-specific DNA-methyltransferase [Candidatus Poribacteria bacterium]